MIKSILNKKTISIGRFLTAFVALFASHSLLAQVPDGYNEFKYPSGKKSSEGYMVNGRPEGFWKTYYENGNLKSEGNRVNHQLDSIWNFYDQDGILSVTISYKNGQKNGWRKSLSKDSIVVKEELFKNDTLMLLKKYFSNGQLKLKLPFKDGEEFGKAFAYDSLGLVKTHWKYSKEKTETFKVNRLDATSKKTGKWMVFENEILVLETHYSRGLKNGVERKYNPKGELIEVLKYSNGKLLKDVKELQKITLERELGSNGLIAKSGGYNKEGKPHGVHRKFDEKGNVKSSKIFENGILSGSGIVKKNGQKDGDWVMFYANGKKLSEGKFKNGKKIGFWKYYYENGNLETEGEYNLNGKQDGLWKEYFVSGNLSEEINYFEGLYDGPFKAYNDSGEVIIQGKYKEDYEDSIWVYTVGDHYEFGSYKDGLKNGEWRSYYIKEDDLKKQIVFKGTFSNGIPIGEHLFWYPTGGLRLLGDYRSGRRSGTWTEYSPGGKIIMITEYSDGLVKRLNGYSIDPSHDPDDYIEYESTGYGN